MFSSYVFVLLFFCFNDTATTEIYTLSRHDALPFYKVDMETHREVPTVEGMALAQFWNCPFVEASAKNRTNVNEVFAEIVREMNLKHSTKEREITCECCCIS